MRVAVQLSLSTVAIAPGESPDQTRVPPAVEIRDSRGRVWSLGEATVSGKRWVVVDGAPIPPTDALQILYYQRRIYLGGIYGWHVENPEGQTPPVFQQIGPADQDPVPPGNRAPAWDMGDIVFHQGVPAEIDLRTRATDPDGDAMTFNVESALRAELVGPFSFNDFKLSYDGRDMGLAEDAPPLVLDTGITISANDNRADGPIGV